MPIPWSKTVALLGLLLIEAGLARAPANEKTPAWKPALLSCGKAPAGEGKGSNTAFLESKRESHALRSLSFP